MSVPINFDEAIEPASMVFVTLLAPMVVAIPVDVTSPVKLPVNVEAAPAMLPLMVPVAVKLPAMLTLPFTSSLEPGVVVPMPTLPSVVSDVPTLLKARLVPEATPKVGVVIVGLLSVGLVNVLFVNVSVPAHVAKVPVVGSVTVVVPVEVRVVGKAPEVTKFPPKVIVLEPLFTPVPP
jgi:hypothetical protein